MNCTKFSHLMTIAFMSLSFSSLHAAEATLKVGVVDIQAVILNVEEGKAARAKLEKEIKNQEKTLKSRRAQIEKIGKEMQSKMALMSNEARMKKQKEVQAKLLKWRKDEYDFQSSIKKRENQATQQIAVRIAKLSEKISSEKKLSLVFEANSSGLLYVANPINLTKEIIDRYPKFVKTLPKTAAKQKSK